MNEHASRPEDKYDRAIAYFEEHPDEIEDYWERPTAADEPNCLFQFLRPPGFREEDRREYGCPTLVKLGQWAATPEMTRRLQDDRRIPVGVTIIGVKYLPAFAEYQRETDALWDAAGLERGKDACI